QRMVAVHNQLSMPPLAKNLMDTAGVQLLADWIMDMDTAITTSADVIVADYRDDFQAGSPTTGWEYLWNSGGPIGNDANYQALLWNGTQYDSDGNPGIPDASDLAWGQLNGNGGHPGRALNQGQTTSRFVIAGFTIQSTGTYEIQNSLVEDANTGCGDGAEVRVYVDNGLIQTVTYPNGGSATFDVNLGTLSAGDKVYICHGPKDTGDGCDGFSWDFSIRQQSVSKGQRIYFDPLPSQHTSAVPFALGAYSSSSLPITYTVAKGPASISGQTVTLTGQPGEVVIRAEQNGNSNYLPAPAVERRFWVTPSNTGIGSGLLATYFHNIDFTQVATFRVDPVIDFKWGSGAPLASMEYNTYSVVWEGEIEPPTSGNYTFTTSTDDGVRLYVDNQLIIDNWQDQAVSATTGQISLTAWNKVPIRMEYYEQGVYAEARLEWSGPDVDLSVVPQRFLYPALASSFPVELLSFGGDLRENQVWLNWETVRELQSDYFAVEKALNGRDFEAIGQVQAAGNSQELQSYQFVDPAPQQGVNYYRLRQVDISGVETYSQTVEIYFDGEYMHLYPNPVSQTEALQLRLNLAKSRQAHLQIWNAQGQLAWEQRADWAKGPQIQQVAMDQLASGTYVLVLNLGDKKWVEKLVVR
ncbi:MAG: PA14 domain-containing protein, partial [Bacteroidota bacterium]